MAKKRKKKIEKEIIIKAKEGLIEIWLSKEILKKIEQDKNSEIPNWIADMYK